MSGRGVGRRIADTAQRTFGHDSLLPGQEDATRALLEGHDVLLVSPTGSGKSLTYQLAGVLLEGCTLVVSPLLALQHDQILGLEDGDERTRGVRISSEESAGRRAEALEEVRAGAVEFLFLSPEQLANDDVRDAVAGLAPSLVAVDEAHCVSAWGHDFRPDYFRLGELLEDVGRPQVVAMTATAAPPVRQDIVERLRMRDHRLVVTGFERPNIELTVLRTATADQERQAVIDEVKAAEGAGIVYCRTRKASEEYAAALGELGRRTAVYHAGLGRAARAEAHERFMDGDIDVMVATSAFGMGIDKPDIRFVVHAQVPESPDTYYQEIGRAGRDGEPAAATLFYRAEDLSLGRFFTGGIPDRVDVATVVAAVRRLDGPGGRDGRDGHDSQSRRALQEETGLGPRKLGRILNLVRLEQVLPGADDGGAPARAGDGDEDDPLVDAVLERAEGHRKLQHSRVEMMRGYAETERCRSDYLLAYFGEELAEPCGHCDNCRAGVATTHVPDDDAEWPLQSRVRHQEFGEGTVTDVEEDRITVLFEDVGYRTLSVDLVREQDLLTSA